MDRARVVGKILHWYDENARNLPWRRPEATPWSILVSEFMLQQTPVERVRRPWQEWLERWPSPAALADAPAGEAVRAWGRLGYPRRALRLHQAAVAIRDRHDNHVPEDLDALLALPGVGPYTAAAVASFAFGQRQLVLDTNVRRVISRIAAGQAHPQPTPTVAERGLAEQFLPETAARAARWAVASMELGALVCVARSPRCDQCPVADLCRWQQSGRPAWSGPPRRAQDYTGTDRQCRGALLAVLRSSDEPVRSSELATCWPEPIQRERALASLLVDGLVAELTGSRYTLPN